MGAKAPEQLNLRRPTVKCDVCGRKFLNIQALKSHHTFLHTRTAVAKRVPFKKQVETRPIKKKLVPLHMLKRVNLSATTPSPKQTNKTEVKEKTPDLAGKQSPKPKKPEFECPICSDKFPVYFTAFRHIQKNHCVDDSGTKVAPNSPQLVKPIRIEVCATCNKEIRSTVPHTCLKTTNKDQYLCLRCEQVINGLVLFQHHVKGMHAEDSQNYFFPSREEFTSWKVDLEEQINLDFIRLNKQKSKEIYHCSYQGAAVTPTTKLCPGAITVREYTKGVHVVYYKEHHGHVFEDMPLKKYNKYCINLYSGDTEELKLEAEDDNDLYLQFKKMVTCIVFDAAKVDVTTLKELLGKALEMTSVLKHYEGAEQNTPLISKCLTDKQISRTLIDSLKPSKRKLSPLPIETKKVEAKKVKKDSPSIEKLVENGVKTKRTVSSPTLNKSASITRSNSLINKSTTAAKSSPAINKPETISKNNPALSKPVTVSKSSPALSKPVSIPKSSPAPNKPVAIAKSSSATNKPVTIQKNSPAPNKPVAANKSTPALNKSVPANKSTSALNKSTSALNKSTSALNKPVAANKSTPVLNKAASFTKTSSKISDEPSQENKKQEEPAPVAPVQRSMLQSPSSFNDSYKNFVDQNFKCLSDTSTPRNKSNVKKKEVVKTKMGQFKVKQSPPSSKEPLPKVSSLKDSSRKVSPLQDSLSNDSSIKNSTLKVSTLKDSTPTISAPKNSTPKDSIPKAAKEAKGSPKTWKAKPDIKYEVKEQENDCNILILKI